MWASVFQASPNRRPTAREVKGSSVPYTAGSRNSNALYSQQIASHVHQVFYDSTKSRLVRL